MGRIRRAAGSAISQACAASGRTSRRARRGRSDEYDPHVVSNRGIDLSDYADGDGSADIFLSVFSDFLDLRDGHGDPIRGWRLASSHRQAHRYGDLGNVIRAAHAAALPKQLVDYDPLLLLPPQYVRFVLRDDRSEPPPRGEDLAPIVPHGVHGLRGRWHLWKSLLGSVDA